MAVPETTSFLRNMNAGHIAVPGIEKKSSAPVIVIGGSPGSLYDSGLVNPETLQ